MPGDLIIDTDPLFAPLLERRGIGLAVSGGPDSLALMLLCAEWRQRQSRTPPIVVYSVDHGLRPEATGEVLFVVEEARKRGLLARGLRWDGPWPAAGLMAAARSARYRLIGDAMAADGADLLLTAHHLADQAETVLMRLAHGSGIEGLSGIAPFSVVEGIEIYRPLLEVDPARLVQVVARAGITPVEDPSNRDLDYERVRWRRMLSPLAGLGLDPRRLSAFARRMGQLDDLVEASAVRALAELVTWLPDGRAKLSHQRLSELAPPVAVRLLSRLLARVGNGRKPNALGAIETLEGKLRERSALKRTTLHGCIVSSDGRIVSIVTEPGRASGRSRIAEQEATVTRN